MAIVLCANDVLVETALAALALGPEARELLLERRHGAHALLVELGLLALAVGADGAVRLALAQYGLALEAGLALLGEGSQAADFRDGHRLGERVLTLEQHELGPFVQDGLEDAQERLGDLILQVVLRVDGQVVVEHVDGVLGLLVGGLALGARHDHVGHAVAELRRRARIALAHLVGELDVRLLAGVLLVGLGELLGDDQVGDVDAVAEQVGDGLLGVVDGALRVAVDEQLLQAHADEVGHQRTVVASHRLDALAVHLVVLVRPGEVEARVALLVDQQVRKVALLELELDRLHERLAHVLGRLATQPHGVLQLRHAELHHHRVRVAVDDLGVERVAVGGGVLGLDKLLGLLDHGAAERRHTLRDLQARQLAHLGAREAVHRVGADLQRQLTAVEHLVAERVLFVKYEHFQ